jgi:hypothetical protein
MQCITYVSRGIQNVYPVGSVFACLCMFCGHLNEETACGVSEDTEECTLWTQCGVKTGCSAGRPNNVIKMNMTTSCMLPAYIHNTV